MAQDRGRLRYGRGKFTHHQNYIDYQLMIARHPNYRGMPGAFAANGKPLWQVSSGRTTSFYQYYEARKQWWTAKADELHLPGKGKESDRWTTAARMIHPTGYRHCLICGELRNVGYFYLTVNLARRLNRILRTDALRPRQSISEVLPLLVTDLGPSGTSQLLRDLFPERLRYFEEHGFTVQAFEASNSLRTGWLSPGFMGDPPYRFDGLHDYCSVTCRKRNDPGRSDENMQTYIHDRRAFVWWAEGNWALADVLFNSAGPGLCVRHIPHHEVERVSPDHIGPLSCGFKHIPFFQPTCQPYNSSKNRRMTLDDVIELRAYERRTGESAASWQVRPLWDRLKAQVITNQDAEELSALMRAMQDVYLRCLHALVDAGRVRFLRTLLHPEFAIKDYALIDLDPSSLRFSGYTEVLKDTPNRRGLAARIVRIAFDELEAYVRKGVSGRRARQVLTKGHETIVASIVRYAGALPTTDLDRRWFEALRGPHRNKDAREAAIGALLAAEARLEPTSTTADKALRKFMLDQFKQIATDVSL